MSDTAAYVPGGAQGVAAPGAVRPGAGTVPGRAATGQGGPGTGTRTLLRPARPADVRAIAELVQPYSDRRVLIAKDLISYFEDVQEFTVAEDVATASAQAADGSASPGSAIVGCGALHVMWDDIAEVRTLAVHADHLGKGVGSALLRELVERARTLGLQRLFCLTFEVEFFASHGFRRISGTPVGTDVFSEMVRSHDDGVAEFLNLARVKPNTLGNTRMLLQL
ncbi:amino-acid N-acetyltransferase [Actinomyces sp. 2119]|uniref:Amino-acid N-acetyltransferase n=1 Tax=Actinomyces lilanjuaniae TaxID=2321394 RepID=A0ABN5PRN6_9ACTO|nr:MULTISPECIES: amino-acid N-acetyltransferase [Actinomyces]AYD89256.1 amino-acid N-acetyltransferase [Actinomyces lilanjuaniae]RJF40670.1 amino-acid N-acetyltransferase [Actinomyces sp. 2119]